MSEIQLHWLSQLKKKWADTHFRTSLMRCQNILIQQTYKITRIQIARDCFCFSILLILVRKISKHRYPKWCQEVEKSNFFRLLVDILISLSSFNRSSHPGSSDGCKGSVIHWLVFLIASEKNKKPLSLRKKNDW